MGAKKFDHPEFEDSELEDDEKFESPVFGVLEGFEDYDDYYRAYLRNTDQTREEALQGLVIMEELYYRLYYPGWRSVDQGDGIRSSIDQDLLNDFSDACLIEVNALLMILEARHFYFYYDMVDFQASCQFKSFLENFDHPGEDTYDVDGDLVCSNTVRHTEETLNDEYHRDLATIAIDIYNKHTKASKLKFVRLLICTFTFSISCKWCMTIFAEDEETGRIGTYQAALARRGEAYTLGLFRDVDADKILAILSIKGAEEDVEDKLKLRAAAEEARLKFRAASEAKLKLEAAFKAKLEAKLQAPAEGKYKMKSSRTCDRCSFQPIMPFWGGKNCEHN